MRNMTLDTFATANASAVRGDYVSVSTIRAADGYHAVNVHLPLDAATVDRRYHAADPADGLDAFTSVNVEQGARSVSVFVTPETVDTARALAAALLAAVADVEQ